MGLDGEIVLKWISEIVCEDVNLINLAEDRDHWRAMLKTGNEEFIG